MKRRLIFAMLLVLSTAMLMSTPVFACHHREEPPPIVIEKEAYCMHDSDSNRYSSNPPYYLGVKYYWWIRINVTALANLDYVVVFDQLGAEFMIEGICYDWPKQPDLPGYDNEWGGNLRPFDFTFDYTAGNPWPERNEDVIVRDKNGDPVASGHVNGLGVEFEGKFASGDQDTFAIEWTGKSCKVHFKWIIGAMEENESKLIYLVISTDINPGGHQEFTSPCTHYLNSGATVKVYKIKQYRCWRYFVLIYSYTTDPIEIKVETN
jgi:hypothetical protein